MQVNLLRCSLGSLRQACFHLVLLLLSLSQSENIRVASLGAYFLHVLSLALVFLLQNERCDIFCCSKVRQKT